MIIRDNQMDQLSAHMERGFEDRMVEHLNQHFGYKTRPMGEAAVLRNIRAGLARARSYFVERERDVARFIDLTFALHLEFELQPEMAWAKKILEDPALTGQQKIDQIHEQLPAKLRELGAQAAKKQGAR